MAVEPFQPEMLTETLRKQVIGCLVKKSNDLDWPRAEEFTQNAALKILETHGRQPIMLRSALLNYWLTAAYYLFLEERRRAKTLRNNWGDPLREYDDNGEGRTAVEIPDERGPRPDQELFDKVKVDGLKLMSRVILNMKGDCRDVLTVYTRQRGGDLADGVKPHEMLEITRQNYDVKVHRCKKKLRDLLEKKSWFRNNRDLLLS